MSNVETLRPLSGTAAGQLPVLNTASSDDSHSGVARGVGWRSTKVRSIHLQRQAVVYVRQSTQQQVLEHRESLSRQYALRDRATALGWPTSEVVTIDDDLGQSGRDSTSRVGFQRLLADVAQNRVGLVLALEMSRLARNSRDWHTLFELCAVRDTLLADEDGVYDPCDVNDRLVLGLKGIMSEMELHMMNGRLERGRRNKAQRGEMFHSVPWGYVLGPDGTVEFDPDEQVRTTVRRLFDMFQELGSAYAVLLNMRQQDVKLPKRDGSGRLVWRTATETIIGTALHHPLYAGAYSWGRRSTQAQIDPSGRITHNRKFRPSAEWAVLLKDHCPAYISWDQYLANQQKLLENMHRPDTRGVPRGGAALLGGILFCGRCGRKMQVSYGRSCKGRYTCSRRRFMPSDQVCGGLLMGGLDEFVAQQLLQTLSPAALELSLAAVVQVREQRQRQEEQLRQNVDRATYAMQYAERQYQAVDPENRLVARTLEQRWEASLRQQQEALETFERFRHEKPVELTPAERQFLEALSHDIPALWSAPETTVQQRKEIVRCLIERVEVMTSKTTPRVDVTIHWAGGFQSQQEFHRPIAHYDDLDNIDQLLIRIGDMRRAGWRAPRIANQLNAEGFHTPKKRGIFSTDVVRSLFRRVEKAEQERHANESQFPHWPVDVLARKLAMPTKKLKDWGTRGWARVIARPFGGVWILWADERELHRLERLLKLIRQGSHPPEELKIPNPVFP